MDRSKWEYKKLGDICILLNGFAFKSEKYVDNGIRVMRITNVQKGEIVDDDPKFYPMSSQSEIQRYMLKENDLLVSLTGNVGRVGLLQRELLPAALNQRVACLRLKGDSTDLRYLFHLMNSDLFENECIVNSQGIAQKNMSTKWLSDYKLPVPPKEDQQRIVAELDCLNEMIALKQEQLKEFDKLAQSIFYDMFGDPVLNEKRWEIRPLGELISIMGGFAFKSSSYVDIGIRLVQIANVWDDKIKWDEITHVPKEDVNKRPDYLLKPGDIVMALTRPIIKSLGSVKIARIRNCDIPCALNQRVCKFAFSNSLLSPHWFYHFARTDYFKDMINSFSSKGMQPNVSTKEIESILTPYIPLSLQQQFAEKISAIEAQKELVKQSIADTQALLDYTMDKYFG